MKKLLLLIPMIAYLAIALCQTNTKKPIIESQVFDSKTKKSIIYATVYNLRSNYGTVSNLRGQFKLQKNQIGDSIRISHLGYRDTIIIFNKQFPETILLHQSSVEIDEVTVLADDEYLYDLLTNIRRSYFRRNIITGDGIAASAKTYYLLESFYKNDRIELIEAFFNGYYGDYDLKKLKTKRGRAGVKPIGSISYISSETSQAFYKHELFIENNIFPINPLQLSKNTLKKQYNLSLTNVYRQNGKKIYEIEFTPKSEIKNAFAGKIWINKDDEAIRKVRLTSDNAEKHPFLPYGNISKIEHVSMTITKTFFESGKNTLINTIDFDYTLDCLYTTGEKHQYQTVAFIKAYDYENQFNLPLFKFSETMHQDFRDVTAIPVDNEFWKSVKEFAINTESKEKSGFIEKYRIESIVPTLRLLTVESHLYNFVYRHWSPDRLRMRDLEYDNSPKGKVKSETREAGVQERLFAYEINTKLYLDYYTRNNTIHYTLNSVIDPYKTYYNDVLNEYSKAYINMYFDLLEIEKRKLEKELINKKPENKEEIEELYERHMHQYEQTIDKFKNDVKRGKLASGMYRWNEIIEKELGVNNIKHFGLFKKGD